MTNRNRIRGLFRLGKLPWEHLFGGDTTAHPFDCDAAALHHIFDGGWIWLLRFDYGVVSAGIMAGRGGLDWDEALQRHP